MRKVTMVLLLLTLGDVAPAFGDLTGAWGGGVFGDLVVPALGFRKSYTDTYKVGASIHYGMSPRKIAEVEYHYSKWNKGEIENKTFLRAGQQVSSPNAKATLRIQGLLANFLIGLKREGFGGKGGKPYAMFGTGFYEYVPFVGGLRYPLNPAIELVSTREKKRALAIVTGVGAMIGLGPKAGLDLRARYNLVLGELRPYFQWGIDKAYPFHLIDLGAGIKFFL
jgi:hypothetical protein